MTGKRIGVLMGGISAEREVSIRTGEAVLDALRARGHHAVPIYVDRDVDLALRVDRIDVAFLALHGRFGEDGCVQGLLELRGIPYTGSGVLASALAMDKLRSKELFRLHNLPTPAYYVLGREGLDHLDEVHGSFGFPVVAKPRGEGSSVGVALARSVDELRDACETALAFDEDVLVERYVAGREVSVAILNDRPLGGVEIVPRSGFYDYAHKYQANMTEYHLPPRVSSERYRGLLEQALAAHRALGCSGATRVDFIVSDRGNEYLLEVNTLPGMTPTSLLPKIARAAGVDFATLCDELLSGAALSAQGTRVRERRVEEHPFDGPERRAAGRAAH